MNYAWAAQVHFGYREEDPILTEFYNGIFSDEVTDESDVGDRAGKPVNVRGTSLLLKDYVSLKFYLTVDDSIDASSLTARFSCGVKTKSASLQKNGSFYTVSFPLSAKELRTLTSVWITDPSGAVVSNRYTDSVSSYCAYCLNVKNVQGSERDAVEKLMAYADAAKAYLDEKYPYVLDEDNLTPVFH